MSDSTRSVIWEHESLGMPCQIGGGIEFEHATRSGRADQALTRLIARIDEAHGGPTKSSGFVGQFAPHFLSRPRRDEIGVTGSS